MTATRRSIPEVRSTYKGSVIHEFAPADIDPDKPPVVIVNGTSGGNEHWGDFPRVLGHKVIAIDARRSNTLGCVPTIGGYASAIEGAIDQVTDQPVDLLGLSLGGVIASEMAIHQEDPDTKKRIANLALLSTIPGYFDKLPPIVRTNLRMAIAAMTSMHPIAAATGVMYGGDLAGNNQLATDLDVVPGIPSLTDMQQFSALQMHMAFHPGQPWMWWLPVKNPLSKITVPTVVIGGENDRITPWPNSVKTASLIKNSELHQLKGAGHLLPQERPEEVAAILREFFDRNRTAN